MRSTAFANSSSLFGAINFIVTMLNMRVKGLTMGRLPVFCWAQLVTAVLLLLVALPVLFGAGLVGRRARRTRDGPPRWWSG